MNKAASANSYWWPDNINLKILNQQGANNPDPSFNYKEAFRELDVEMVKRDVNKMLTTSQDWWPADWGHYGPFMIRMVRTPTPCRLRRGFDCCAPNAYTFLFRAQAWHAAGTYRISDGRGGANTANQRFAPLNSWPDNANLDKARRLMWPVKQKYGRKLSWGDLMMLTGNQALEIMGLKTIGFAFGREDIYSPEDDVYWGPEKEMLSNDRFDENGDIKRPLGASEMGLIYVNPEGHDNEPNPTKSAHDIRQTFRNMAMDDYETVALIAGGHTFGKTHGAAPVSHQGPEPEGASIEHQQLGYLSDYGTGKGKDTTTSGLEGAWTETPIQWDMNYFKNLFEYEWEVHKGPGGRHQWRPTDKSTFEMVPDAHEKGKKNPPMMFTTDISLKIDPIYGPISRHFYHHPDEFSAAFAKAWYKLLHRDMGPVSRCLGSDVPEPQLWQDPIPSLDHELIDDEDVAKLKKQILGSTGIAGKILGSSGPCVSELVKVAWGSACTYRGTDHRGGANGARIRLAPQNTWKVNDPDELKRVLEHLEQIQLDFNEQQKGSNKRVSLADLIVLGGCAAIEHAAKNAGNDINIPFSPGRTDASSEQTVAESFDALEPSADGFRNYLKEGQSAKPEELLLNHAHLLTLTSPEMTVLLGGLRVLKANTGNSEMGVFTKNPETLTNDFFVNLLDINTTWSSVEQDKNLFDGLEYGTGKLNWKASRFDLIFGSNSELRAIAEYYGSDDSNEVFLKDFVKAWTKVMELDRFDLK
jgi:catalase-peroxidase